jgi:hypothetical protein
MVGAVQADIKVHSQSMFSARNLDKRKKHCLGREGGGPRGGGPK